MALFKILQGPSSRIDTATTPLHEGYCYFTPDNGNFYIDAQVNGSLERILINPKDYLIEQNDGVKIKFWCGTKEEYNALETKDDTVFYIVTGEGGSGSSVDVSEQFEEHNADPTAHSDIRSEISNLSVIKEINAGLEQKFWRGTKAEYEALASYDDTVLYIITDDEGGSAVSAEDNIFIAVYGTTTAAEIYEAHEDGKAVFCVNNGAIGNLINCTANSAYFSLLDSTTDGDMISCQVLYVNGGAWSLRFTELQKKIYGSGILKVNDEGEVVDATPGVDYVVPTDVEDVYLADVVSYTAETRTDEEKATARSNIGAEESGAAAQALTDAKAYTDTAVADHSYTKAETVSDATKTAYGLSASATPNDVFSAAKTLIDDVGSKTASPGLDYDDLTSCGYTLVNSIDIAEDTSAVRIPVAQQINFKNYTEMLVRFKSLKCSDACTYQLFGIDDGNDYYCSCFSYDGLRTVTFSMRFFVARHSFAGSYDYPILGAFGTGYAGPMIQFNSTNTDLCIMKLSGDGLMTSGTISVYVK